LFAHGGDIAGDRQQVVPQRVRQGGERAMLDDAREFLLGPLQVVAMAELQRGLRGVGIVALGNRRVRCGLAAATVPASSSAAGQHAPIMQSSAPSRVTRTITTGFILATSQADRTLEPIKARACQRPRAR
jgi:hypothetical protein